MFTWRSIRKQKLKLHEESSWLTTKSEEAEVEIAEGWLCLEVESAV